MGCFSFMCKECGKPALSTSFSGQRVIMFQLKDGKVIQKMRGEYDSYGRVFKDGTQREDVEHKLRESHEWDMDWGECVDLMFDGDDGDGFAVVHEACFTGKIPTTASDGDPNQGWGDDWELMGNVDSNFDFEGFDNED